MKFPPKVGSRRGDWILKERRRNPNGSFTDTWILDPTITMKPFEDPLYCTSEDTGYGDSTNGYIWKHKKTIVGAENSVTSLKVGKAAANTYFAFYCGLTDNAVTTLPTAFTTARGWRVETAEAISQRTFIGVRARLLNRAAYAHAGKIVVRFWKGTSADGTNLTALTAWTESPNILSFTATSEEAKTDEFPVNVTFSLASNEYLYVQFAWKVTTAATHVNAGVKLAVNTTTPTAVLIPSATHKAYKYGASNATSAITNPSVAITEFTSTDYTNVGSDDAVYVVSPASATTFSDKYANMAHRFTFDLSAYNIGGNSVTQVEYRWDGYRSYSYGILITEKVQHKETGPVWIDDYITIPTTDGAGFERTKTLTNISAILINNIFEFGLTYVLLDDGIEGASGSINSDYVELAVTWKIRFTQNLSVIRDKFSFVYTPLAIPALVRQLKENLSVISDVPKRIAIYTRKQVQQVLIGDVFKRIVSFWRVMVQSLLIQDFFRRSANYLRAFPQQIILRDILKRFATFPRKLIQNLFVLADVFIRRVSLIRKLPQEVVVRDIFKRVVSIPRKMVQNLSVLGAVFVRRVAHVRKFVNATIIRDVFKRIYGTARRLSLDLSSIGDRFFRRVAYTRKLVETTLISEVFKRIVGFPRRFIQNLRVIADVFTRRIAYTRKIVNLTVILDVFKRIVGLPRKFVEDLSALRDVFIRRIAFLRRLPQNLSVIRDVFSFVYVPVVKVYKFVQQVIIQALFVRRASYIRKLVENLSVIQDVFSFIRIPFVKIYKFIEQVVIRDVFVRRVAYIRKTVNTTVISDVFKRVVGFPRRLTQNLSTLAVRFVRKVTYLRRIVQNLSILRDVFSSILVSLVKAYKFVQEIIIQALLIRRVSIFRKVVNTVIISDVFKRFVGFPRRLVQNLSVISVRFLRRITYLRKIVQTTLIRDVFKRIVGFPRKMVQDLSVLATVFRRRIAWIRTLRQVIIIQEVFKRVASYVRAFIEIVVVRDVFKKIQAFTRQLMQTLIVSDVFKRIVGLPRRFIENLSAISSVFVRRVGLLRRLVQTVLFQDVFRRIQTLIRFFRQDLSTIRDIFIRRVNYLRRLPQFIYIKDKFSFIYVPIIRVYRFIQSLIISTLLQRRISYVRRVQLNLSTLRDLFSFIYAPLVRIYRFVQNLSVIGDVFRYQVATPTIVLLQRKASSIQAEIQDLYEKVKKKAEFYLGK